MRSRKSSALVLKTRRAYAVFVCSKCLERSDGGAKMKRRLKKRLSEVSDARNRKRPKLVLTSCLGICPKQAVVTASTATLSRGEVVLLQASSIERAVAALAPQRA
jgi:predicted metal-binding protein